MQKRGNEASGLMLSKLHFKECWPEAWRLPLLGSGAVNLIFAGLNVIFLPFSLSISSRSTRTSQLTPGFTYTISKSLQKDREPDRAGLHTRATFHSHTCTICYASGNPWRVKITVMGTPRFPISSPWLPRSRIDDMVHSYVLRVAVL